MHVGRTLIAWFLVLLTGTLVPSGGAHARVAEAGLEIVNVARLSYFDPISDSLVEIESNTSRIVVGELQRFSLGVPGTLERLAGERVAFTHRLENTGNVTDSYALTLGNAIDDEGDLVDLLLVVDADGNGIPDPGETPPAERIELAAEEPLVGQRVVVAGEIGDIAFQGQHSIVEIRLPVGRSISATVSGERSAELAALPNGTRIYAHWAVQDLQLLPERAPR